MRFMVYRAVTFAILLAILATAGCAVLRATAPLSVLDFSGSDSRHDTLVIFLPGIEDQARDFERAGFVQAVRQQGLPVDMIAVDAHIGYYLTHDMVERLRHEVILPARQRGYSRIWLAGISLGGMGAMLYANDNPHEIDGIIAIAPYMGSEDTVSDVKAAGGPERWQPDATLPGDFRQEAWLWLKDYKRDKGAPVLVLAYGKDDRFSEAHRVIAQMLPSDQVIRLPGEHNWRTWLNLWQATLDSVDLAPNLAQTTEEVARLSAQDAFETASSDTPPLQ